MRESKYYPLQSWLEKSKIMTLKSSFDEIETIIGFTLPDSAYRYSAWWGNHVQNSRHTKAWMDIGWRVENLDLDSKIVTFCKV